MVIFEDFHTSLVLVLGGGCYLYVIYEDEIKGRGCYIPQPHQTLQACHFVICMVHVLMFCTQQNLHVLQAILKIQTHKWKSLEDVMTTTNLLSFPVLVMKVLLLNLLVKPCL
jgi:hypothetical protein